MRYFFEVTTWLSWFALNIINHFSHTQVVMYLGSAHLRLNTPFMNLHTNVALPKGTLSASLMIDVNAVSCRIYRTITYPSIIIFCQKLGSNFNGCLNEIFIPLSTKLNKFL